MCSWNSIAEFESAMSVLDDFNKEGHMTFIIALKIMFEPQFVTDMVSHVYLLQVSWNTFAALCRDLKLYTVHNFSALVPPSAHRRTDRSLANCFDAINRLGYNRKFGWFVG